MKAIVLIQKGFDLYICDFEIQNYDEDQYEFESVVRFHFDERWSGEKEHNTIFVKENYFTSSPDELDADDWEIIEITTTEL